MPSPLERDGPVQAQQCFPRARPGPYDRRMRSLLIAVSCLLLAPSSAIAAAWDKPGWQLTFQDEFDGVGVDAANWVKRYKWGEAPINSELQAYVDDAFQVQNGILSIVGDKRTATYAGQTFQYASGVLCSVLEQKYGYFFKDPSRSPGHSHSLGKSEGGHPTTQGVYEAELPRNGEVSACEGKGERDHTREEHRRTLPGYRCGEDGDFECNE